MRTTTITTAEPDIRLECTDCETATDYNREGENVVSCLDCGKRHSTDSLIDRNTPGVER